MTRKEAMSEKVLKVKIAEKGPYIIQGGVTLVHPNGSETEKENTVALCRCGYSVKKPFCDGSHKDHDNL